MTTAVNGATGTDNLFSTLGLTQKPSTQSNALDQQDFLKLMTVQMQNQDPLKPMENTEFFSQIAQFSTVSGIGKLQDSFSTLAGQLTSNQSLQAAALIGHDVLVASDAGVLGADGMRGAIDVPQSGRVRLEIRDTAGALVRTLDLGTQSAGQIEFKWNGTDAGGEELPEGLYKISASVQGSGTAVAATTYALDQVRSVSLDQSSGLYVDLGALGEQSFSSVIRIQ